MTNRRTAIFASAMLAAIAAAPAAAHQIYQLQGNQWAIICDDGSGYSFSGSQNGAIEVSALLCGPGAMAGGGAGDIVVLVDAAQHLDRDADGKLIRVPVTIKEEGVRAAPITVNEEGVRAAPTIVQDEGLPATKRKKH
jgi:hypothetical protein